MSECFKALYDVHGLVYIEHPISHQGPIEMVEVEVYEKIIYGGEGLKPMTEINVIGFVSLPRCTNCGLFVKGE